jgi:hypothetical protein
MLLLLQERSRHHGLVGKLAVLNGHFDLYFSPLHRIEYRVHALLECVRLLLRLHAGHFSEPEFFLGVVAPVSVVEHRSRLELHNVVCVHVKQVEQRVVLVPKRVNRREFVLYLRVDNVFGRIRKVYLTFKKTSACLSLIALIFEPILTGIL